MSSLHEIEISFYDTNYEGKGTDLHKSYTPEEAEERRTYLGKYRYSEEKFSSEDEYIDFLAQNLSSPEEINLFLKYLYRYDLTSEKTHSQFIENQGTTYSGDWWRSPLQISTEYNQSEGRFLGIVMMLPYCLKRFYPDKVKILFSLLSLIMHLLVG